MSGPSEASEQVESKTRGRRATLTPEERHERKIVRDRNDRLKRTNLLNRYKRMEEKMGGDVEQLEKDIDKLMQIKSEYGDLERLEQELNRLKQMEPEFNRLKQMEPEFNRFKQMGATIAMQRDNDIDTSPNRMPLLEDAIGEQCNVPEEVPLAENASELHKWPMAMDQSSNYSTRLFEQKTPDFALANAPEELGEDVLNEQPTHKTLKMQLINADSTSVTKSYPENDMNLDGNINCVFSPKQSLLEIEESLKRFLQLIYKELGEDDMQRQSCWRTPERGNVPGDASLSPCRSSIPGLDEVSNLHRDRPTEIDSGTCMTDAQMTPDLASFKGGLEQYMPVYQGASSHTSMTSAQPETTSINLQQENTMKGNILAVEGASKHFGDPLLSQLNWQIPLAENASELHKWPMDQSSNFEMGYDARLFEQKTLDFANALEEFARHDLLDEQPVHKNLATQIRKEFRGWKRRKQCVLIRQRIVKIQAHVRGHIEETVLSNRLVSGYHGESYFTVET